LNSEKNKLKNQSECYGKRQNLEAVRQEKEIKERMPTLFWVFKDHFKGRSNSRRMFNLLKTVEVLLGVVGKNG